MMPICYAIYTEFGVPVNVCMYDATSIPVTFIMCNLLSYLFYPEKVVYCCFAFYGNMLFESNIFIHPSTQVLHTLSSRYGVKVYLSEVVWHLSICFLDPNKMTSTFEEFIFSL